VNVSLEYEREEKRERRESQIKNASEMEEIFRRISLKLQNRACANDKKT